jgi:hypothetical protein
MPSSGINDNRFFGRIMAARQGLWPGESIQFHVKIPVTRQYLGCCYVEYRRVIGTFKVLTKEYDAVSDVDVIRVEVSRPKVLARPKVKFKKTYKLRLRANYEARALIVEKIRYDLDNPTEILLPLVNEGMRYKSFARKIRQKLDAYIENVKGNQEHLHLQEPGGDCDLCGNWDSHLEDGICNGCKTRYYPENNKVLLN